MNFDGIAAHHHTPWGHMGWDISDVGTRQIDSAGAWEAPITRYAMALTLLYRENNPCLCVRQRREHINWKDYMNIRILVLVLSAVALTGCAHGMMRGGVAMKTSENEAHVCLGDNEVKVGDAVTAYMNNCPVRGGARARDGGGSGICEKQRLGKGTVTALLNRHYSVVQFEPGVKFDEGTFVEKQ